MSSFGKMVKSGPSALRDWRVRRAQIAKGRDFRGFMGGSDFVQLFAFTRSAASGVSRYLITFCDSEVLLLR